MRRERAGAAWSAGVPKEKHSMQNLLFLNYWPQVQILYKGWGGANENISEAGPGPCSQWLPLLNRERSNPSETKICLCSSVLKNIQHFPTVQGIRRGLQDHLSPGHFLPPDPSLRTFAHPVLSASCDLHAVKSTLLSAQFSDCDKHIRTAVNLPPQSGCLTVLPPVRTPSSSFIVRSSSHPCSRQLVFCPWNQGPLVQQPPLESSFTQ